MLWTLAVLSMIGCKTEVPQDARTYTLVYQSKVGGEFEPCG